MQPPSGLRSIRFHHSDLLNVSRSRKPIQQNEAHILAAEPGPTGLAAVAVVQTVGHMDPIISPLQHWHLGEHRPTVYGFYGMPFSHTATQY